MSILRELWTDFRTSDVYRHYIVPPPLSRSQRDDFEEHMRQILKQVFKVFCFAFFVFILISWPPDFYLYEGHDRFVTLLGYTRVAFAVANLGIIIGISKVEFIQNNPSRVVYCSLGLLGFVTGCVTSQLGGFDSPAYYWIYFFPILTVFFINLYLVERALAVLVTTSLCATGFFWANPEHLEYSMLAQPLLFNSGTVMFAILGGHFTHNLYKRTYIQGREIEEERKRSEELLLNILPEDIASQLKDDRGLIAESYDEATVMFADLVNFTPLAESMHSDSIVLLLDDIFSSFDQMSESYDLEKIKTIGDEYFIVSGAPRAHSKHAVEAARFALAVQQEMKKYRYPGKDERELTLRIGLNTGPLVGGVIGTEKFVYDVWGDTVNTGSRMETQGVPGEIQVTPRTRECLMEQSDGEEFEFEERGRIEVKGKGSMNTFLLQDPLDRSFVH